VAFFVVAIAGCASDVHQTTVFQTLEPREETCEMFFLRQRPESTSRGTKVASTNTRGTGDPTACSAKRVIEVLRERACSIGADAVYIYSWRSPHTWGGTCYWAKADFYTLRPLDWPAINTDRATIMSKLDERSRRGLIERVEGIWTDSEINYEIAVIPDSPGGSSDFLAVVLESNEHPWWKSMEVKAEIDKTAYANIYEIKFYRNDRSADTTTGTIDDTGLLTIRSSRAGTGEAYDSLWIRKYPSITAVTSSPSN
jgi:hypothetical protein